MFVCVVSFFYRLLRTSDASKVDTAAARTDTINIPLPQTGRKQRTQIAHQHDTNYHTKQQARNPQTITAHTATDTLHAHSTPNSIKPTPARCHFRPLPFLLTLSERYHSLHLQAVT